MEAIRTDRSANCTIWDISRVVRDYYKGNSILEDNYLGHLGLYYWVNRYLSNDAGLNVYVDGYLHYLLSMSYGSTTSLVACL